MNLIENFVANMGSASLNSNKETNVWANSENAYLRNELAATKVEKEIMAHHYDMMQREKFVCIQYYNELLVERNELLAKKNI